MVIITCASCGHENGFARPYPFHAGFSNQGFLYNDDGNLTLVWSSFEPAYEAWVGKKFLGVSPATNRQFLKALCCLLRRVGDGGLSIPLVA